MKEIQHKIWEERKKLESSKKIHELKKKRLKQAEKIKQSIEEELRKLNEELEKCEDKKYISPFPLQPNTIPIPPPPPPMSATYRDKKNVVVNLNDALATNPKLKKVAPEEEPKDSVKDFVSELKVKLKSEDGQTEDRQTIEEKIERRKKKGSKYEEGGKQGNFFTGILKPQHVQKPKSQLKEGLEELKKQNEFMKSRCSELDEKIRNIENESRCLKDLYQKRHGELEQKKAEAKREKTNNDIQEINYTKDMLQEILKRISGDETFSEQQKKVLEKLLQNKFKELDKLSKGQQQEQQENGTLSVTSKIKLSDPSVKKYVKKSEEKVRQQG